MEIRSLSEQDAQAWWDLRLESLIGEPFAFGKSVEEHRATPVESIEARFRHPAEGYISLGAFEEGRLIGMMTYIRETGAKDRHKGRIYGVYVSPGARGKGVARRLLREIIERASRDATLEQILLAVASTQVAAKALYRRFGFETFGIEPRALKLGHEYVDEEHMILMLSCTKEPTK